MRALQVVNWMRVKNFAQLKDSDEKYVNTEPLTQMKAMKLLYYMQAASLVILNRPLFDESIIAGKGGPIVKSVQDRYYSYCSIVDQDSITDEDRADYKLVQSSPTIRDIVNTIYDFYGQRSASDLSRKSISKYTVESGY